MTGAIDMDSHLISNLLDPVSSQDAVTKKYLEDQVKNLDASNMANFKNGLRHGAGVWKKKYIG